MTEALTAVEVCVTVNGRAHTRTVEPRLLLSDFLRHELGLTGTHVGCEHGVCGACTVLVDGDTARSCLMFGVQADGCAITTVEGLAPSPSELSPLQDAFWTAHGLQCGFCTPGILISMEALLRENPSPSDEEIRAGLSGNLCRCTGYQNIVKAVRLAADSLTPPTPLSRKREKGEPPTPLPSPTAGLQGGKAPTSLPSPTSGRGVGGEGCPAGGEGGSS